MRINSNRLLDEFMELVRIDSAPRAELDIAKVLQAKLEHLGLSVEMDQAGKAIQGNCGNLIAKLPGNKAAPTLLFCAHMDRVTPGIGIKPQIDQGIIRSDGTTILAADDVAGLVSILEGIRIVLEDKIPHGNIEVVFTIAEEGGLFGAKGLDPKVLAAKMGFFLDAGGPVGTIVTNAPSQMSLEMEFQGKAAHAGINPEDGINAIVVAAEAISQMKLGRIDKETTANIGVIKGGEATNIVTETVLVKGETRSLNRHKLDDQTSHMEQEAKKAAAKHGAQVAIATSLSYPPFKLAATEPVVVLAQRAAQAIGLTPTLEGTGGGSDANIVNSYGIPSVVLGLGFLDVHSKAESIPIAEMERSAAYVASLIKNA